MMVTGPAVSLQDPILRFAKALTVPRRLLALHPRQRGNSGNAAALAPAITLGVIAAFEGFVEEFIAVGAIRQGLGFAHVAKTVGALNNPDVATFERLVVGQLGVPPRQVGSGFAVDIWRPPAIGATTAWWAEGSLIWSRAREDAEAWMQVRHLLTHGLTSGWRAEYWPAPLRTGTRPAHSVLRQTPSGRHTLVIHGAITCARIYVETSRHLADLTAQHLGETVDVSVLPDFPLYAEQADQPTSLPGAPESTGTPDEPIEEGEDAPRTM